ncbi:PaaI family thioesterase [Mageeibacillus indolicus]|jgi:hypothetical protein|uniref:Thioesterase domain-containing protein n=2 Tax=Mageeibacillus indolicus TaxID=884684 RepID=D3R087_MAGIU|nr:PaaI family thioesterase [Mageeibacillus indolicus]ADC91195.1 hypothetical protein HMPREF0868_0256 [Mageeibacillus indolicus UPII9-5]KFA57126.1 hypothetical protein HMPREF1632_05355 [Mageeibacillus indolicus 0009-5]PNH18871.1 hypothetical protein B7R76_04780 [Mageeibacillus indolicus]
MEEKYKEYAHQFVTKNHFCRFMNPEVLMVCKHYVKARLPLRPDLENGLGMFHGGIIYAFGDSMVGMAALSEGELGLTLSGNISYFSNTKEGGLNAEVICLHDGRSTSVYRVEFRDDGGKLLAEGRYTMKMLNRERAANSSLLR